MKNNFMITLNSLNLLSWDGSDIYNCNYYINLSSVLDYNYKFEKNYKITFSFKGNRSIVLVGDVIGVYLNNVSYNIQTQENKRNSNLLGLLNTKYFNKTGEVITKETDNPPFIIKGLNNSSTLSITVKFLILNTTNVRTLGLGNLINWYKFLINDKIGNNIYNYITLLNDGVLTNGTINNNDILDLTAAGSYMTMPTFDFTAYPSGSPLSLSFWISTTNPNSFCPVALQGNGNFIVTISPREKNKVSMFYGGIQSIVYLNDNTFQLNNGDWFHLTIILGNVDTHKLYINGLLVYTGVNTNLTLTGVRGNFRLGTTANATANYILGYMSDFRFYGRELGAQEISDYFYSHPIEYPNYQMKLNFEELE